MFRGGIVCSSSTRACFSDCIKSLGFVAIAGILESTSVKTSTPILANWTLGVCGGNRQCTSSS